MDWFAGSLDCLSVPASAQRIFNARLGDWALRYHRTAKQPLNRLSVRIIRVLWRGNSLRVINLPNRKAGVVGDGVRAHLWALRSLSTGFLGEGSGEPCRTRPPLLRCAGPVPPGDRGGIQKRGGFQGSPGDEPDKSLAGAERGPAPAEDYVPGRPGVAGRGEEPVLPHFHRVRPVPGFETPGNMLNRVIEDLRAGADFEDSWGTSSESPARNSTRSAWGLGRSPGPITQKYRRRSWCRSAPMGVKYGLGTTH